MADALDGRARPGEPCDMDAVILAVDIGGTRLKAGLVDAAGRVVDEASAEAPVPLAPDGRSEVDVEVWWTGFARAAERLSRHTGFKDVAAVVVTGLTRTQVLLDAEARPVRPAITWRDTRAAPVPYACEPTDAFHPLARLAWLAVNEPAVLKQAAAVVDPKDAIAARLTGRIASDAVALARLVSSTRTGAGAAFGSLVPDLLSPGTVIGPVREGLGLPSALEGRPVVMASHDTWTAAVGLGALRVGAGYALSGTSDVAGLFTESPVTAPGLMAVPWGERLHHLGGPSQNGADVIPWIEGVTRRALPDLLAAPRSARPLLFLPFLSGERVPYWDPDLRGAFMGLDRSHTAGDLAWAVVDGAGLALRDVIERAEVAAGFRLPALRIAGGATRVRAWAQARADILGRPVIVADAEPGLTGGAVVAAVALGWHADLAAAQEAMTGQGAQIAPDPARHAVYDQLFAVYRQAVDATATLSHALAKTRFPNPASRE